MINLNIQFAKVKATIAPILFECIRLNIPEGVELKIDVPNSADDEFRYVPDVELKQLQSELRAIDHEKEETLKAKEAKRALKQKEKAQAMLLSILSPFNETSLPPSSDDLSDKDEKPQQFMLNSFYIHCSLFVNCSLSLLSCFFFSR